MAHLGKPGGPRAFSTTFVLGHSKLLHYAHHNAPHGVRATRCRAGRKLVLLARQRRVVIDGGLVVRVNADDLTSGRLGLVNSTLAGHLHVGRDRRQGL